mmetsp:Transcript_5589/g.8570  ORF Transcript_5589/g.8570 Transcript_5589/m.8570 type:complete len:337 (-) Transcript_5589:804-1814(-)|eukprot:CAMPEP_0195286358 /NCGR_PEP_ID=MMETSP0707-20130614/3845_1 /TAXON_ID=33640 /ORGANISM="Asterionellopsis glacialis, Strain CCMP134" /LENGTH=336 /DNA_ID=CAMNT_0040345991 /DNA_START=158 /DNA_END=1168 /DNA_ORIENTATION=-
MKTSQSIRLLILAFAIANSVLCCNASTASRLQNPTTQQSRTVLQTTRGGGGPQRPTGIWSSSPIGIHRNDGASFGSKKQTGPIVEDIDEETSQSETKEMIDAFLTRDSRQTFISRVYAILTGQLLVTAASIFIFGTNKNLANWVQRSGTAVPMLSLLVSTIAWFMICMSPRARRESPIKWQLLTLFTLGESISVGFISSFYKFQSVLSAMLATALATVSVSAYTIMQKNPKYDLSQWGMTLSSLGMIFIAYGLIHVLELFGILPAGFLPYSDIVYSLFGAGLFSLFLAHHTKLIVSGKHSKYQMNEKDYVFGAMSLYNDIINMFIYILRVLGEDRE